MSWTWFWFEKDSLKRKFLRKFLKDIYVLITTFAVLDWFSILFLSHLISLFAWLRYYTHAFMFRYINVWRMYQLSLRALFASFFYQSRAVGRFENLGGHNLLFLVGIRLADLTKSGGAITPLVPVWFLRPCSLRQYFSSPTIWFFSLHDPVDRFFFLLFTGRWKNRKHK